MFEVRYLEPEIATAQILLRKRRESGGRGRIQNITSNRHDAIILICCHIPT
jgi:hypothetical protein